MLAKAKRVKKKRLLKVHTAHPVVVENTTQGAKIIFAIDAEFGKEYIDWKSERVMKVLDHVSHSGMTFVQVETLSKFGERWAPHEMSPRFPLIDDPSLMKRIKTEALKYRADLESRETINNAQAKKPRLDSEGKPQKKKLKVPLDERTGCQAGSVGHAMGTIMLDNGMKKATKPKTIDLMAKWLQKNGTDKDPNKYKEDFKGAKAMSSSWYSTFTSRKSHIYSVK